VAMRNVEKTIDGHEVSVTTFDGVTGMLMHARLIAVLGPSLGAAFRLIRNTRLEGAVELDEEAPPLPSGKGSSFFEDLTLDVAQAEGVVQELTKVYKDPRAFADLALAMLKESTVDGQEVNRNSFGVIFAGELSLMYKVLALVVEVNYGDFFAQVRDSLSGLLSFAGIRTSAATTDTPSSSPDLGQI